MPIRVAPVESSAPHFTSDSSARLFRTCGIDALGELPDRLERPAVGTHADDRLGGRLADVLHRVQPEVDDASDDGEVLLRRVHVRREHVDPHLPARVHVERHAVLRVHDRGDERRHVLLGWFALSHAVRYAMSA